MFPFFLPLPRHFGQHAGSDDSLLAIFRHSSSTFLLKTSCMNASPRWPMMPQGNNLLRNDGVPPQQIDLDDSLCLKILLLTLFPLLICGTYWALRNPDDCDALLYSTISFFTRLCMNAVTYYGELIDWILSHVTDADMFLVQSAVTCCALFWCVQPNRRNALLLKSLILLSKAPPSSMAYPLETGTGTHQHSRCRSPRCASSLPRWYQVRCGNPSLDTAWAK